MVFSLHWEVMLHEVCSQMRQDHDNYYFDLGKKTLGELNFFIEKLPIEQT